MRVINGNSKSPEQSSILCDPAGSLGNWKVALGPNELQYGFESHDSHHFCSRPLNHKGNVSGK